MVVSQGDEQREVNLSTGKTCASDWKSAHELNEMSKLESVPPEGIVSEELWAGNGGRSGPRSECGSSCTKIPLRPRQRIVLRKFVSGLRRIRTPEHMSQ